MAVTTVSVIANCESIPSSRSMKKKRIAKMLPPSISARAVGYKMKAKPLPLRFRSPTSTPCSWAKYPAVPNTAN
eukprot:CAMPEP_0185774636 /NCGR_PEP_ID=MMETSP1174-20130828/79151_1 /TAXON_ID=35687 /ORGANISM="Dictyocha speculum, Strain CCMP1381" /LENGTH=73 /DNA_ID=CAMNT_0028461909 /DNA_START=66 /DNA_END=284 /DNA_ORIENTATION=-